MLLARKEAQPRLEPARRLPGLAAGRHGALSQIFTPSADTWLRFSLLAFIVSLAGLFLVLGGYVSAGYQTRVGWFREQPVPFSHKHHVGDDGIDCRYCHTSVETSERAGLPATHVCMTCHSQLWTGAPMLAPVRASLASGKPLEWNRVAKLPDYVYFNHSIHVARGVACVECHGRVDQMPLMKRDRPFTMQFCLSCHRDPAPHLRPPSQVTRMDWSGVDARQLRAFGEAAMRRHHIDPARLDSCELCHR